MAQSGKAAVHGIGGGLAFSGLVKTQSTLVGASVTDSANVTALIDGTGATVGLAATQHNRQCTFEIIPLDSAGNLITAKANIKLPAPLAKVTISDFGIDELDGDWNYIGGGTIALSTDGYIRVTLPCAQYAQTDGATPTAIG